MCYAARLILIAFVLLSGCTAAPSSDQQEVSISTTETLLEPTVAVTPPTPTVDPDLILESPQDFFPELTDARKGYQVIPFYEVGNGIIGRDWGSEFEELLIGMGRITGYATFYSQQDWDVPVEYFVLIEQFDSIEGATDFFEHDFPGEFRMDAFEAEETELGNAHQARVRRNMEPPGEEPGTVLAFVEFRYNNMTVLVRGKGSSMDFPLSYTKRVANLVLDNLQKSSGE